MPSQFSSSWISSSAAPPLRSPAGHVMSSSSQGLQDRMVSGAPHNGSGLHDSEMASCITALSKTMMQSSRVKLPRKKRNGVITSRPLSPSSSPNNHASPQTERSESSEKKPQTAIPNLGSTHSRMVCPELAIGYTGSLISGRAEQLVSNQCQLELRLALLQRKLRERQLSVVHSHTKKQLECDPTQYSPLPRRRKSSGSRSLTSVCTTESLVDVEMIDCDLPIQVDGSLDDAFLHPRVDCQRHGSLVTTSSEGTHTADDSGCDLELEGIAPAVTRLQQRLKELEGMVDGYMTEDSSDEEEEEGEEERGRVSRWVGSAYVFEVELLTNSP